MNLIYNNGEDVTTIAERIIRSSDKIRDTNITPEQVKKTLVSFQGDELASTIALEKYFIRDDKNNVLETTYEEMKNRWATEISSIEQMRPHWQNTKERQYFLELYDYLIPGGRQMLALGNKYIRKASLSNCYTTKIEDDSLEGIFKTGFNIAKTFSYSGGQGIDLSPLRPNGALVSNTAMYSTGAVSYAGFYSYITGLIGQRGRRGALILTMRVDHPDILEFIRLKTKSTKTIEFANISVKITDEFMRAVENDGEVTLWFDTKHEQIRVPMKARRIWNKLIYSARDCSEPGALFWDTAVRGSTSECYPELRIYNPNPCQPAEALLLTPNGITTMGEIKIGDIIWSGKRWTTVINKTMTGDKEVYEYRTDIGSFLGTNNHNVVSRGKKRPVGNAREIDSAPVSEGEQSITYKIASVEFKGVRPVYSITVEAEEHTYWTDGLLVGNCGEQIMDPDSACCLASLILPRFIHNPFTPQAQFNFSLFQEMVTRAVRHLDNVVEIGIPNHALPEQEEKAFFGRRIGLGITGLADVFSSMGVRYGSDESLEITRKIFESKRNTEYRASIQLAKERGPFPLFNKDKHYDCEFCSRLPQSIIDEGRQFGQRNVAIGTLPPVGSGTIVVQCSGSGIESIIFREYDRYVVLGGERKSYRVVSPAITRYKLMYPEATKKEIKELFPQADEIPWEKSMDLQSVIQEYIDNAISKTVNLPKNVSYETVNNIYMAAWKKGLKGVTVYRDKSREGVIVDAEKQDDKNNPEQLLDTRVFKFRAEGGDKFYLHVSYRNGDILHPYQIFTTNYKANENDRFIKLSNDLKKIVEDREEVDSGKLGQQLDRANNSLEKITRLVSLLLKYDRLDDVLTVLNVHGFVGTLAKNMYDILSSSRKEEELQVCNECGSTNMIKESGCMKCMDCGYSKCG